MFIFYNEKNTFSVNYCELHLGISTAAFLHHTGKLRCIVEIPFLILNGVKYVVKHL